MTVGLVPKPEPLSTHRALGLSRDAQVLHLGPDRLVLDPEDYSDKLRVRLDRRLNTTGARQVHVDEYRDLALEEVVRGLPVAFHPHVARVVSRFRTFEFKSRRRKLGGR